MASRRIKIIDSIGLVLMVVLIADFWVLYANDYFDRKFPNLFVPKHNLALAYARDGQMLRAELMEREALKSQKHGNSQEKWVGHLLMASFYLQRQDDAGAMQELKSALILNPWNPAAYKAMAGIYHRQGASENAEMVLKVALNININDQESWDMLKYIKGES
jgi:tetratricopeptide (TPR) repeat protein